MDAEEVALAQGSTNAQTAPIPLDTSSGILAVLRDELPDFGTNLYLQSLPEFSTFHFWKHLPKELQQIVLKLNFTPRNLRVGTWGKPANTRSPPYKPPTVLHINRDSRAFGLMHYQVLLSCHDIKRCVTYINPRIEPLRLSELYTWAGLYSSLDTDELPPSLAKATEDTRSIGLPGGLLRNGNFSDVFDGDGDLDELEENFGSTTYTKAMEKQIKDALLMTQNTSLTKIQLGFGSRKDTWAAEMERGFMHDALVDFVGQVVDTLEDSYDNLKVPEIFVG